MIACVAWYLLPKKFIIIIIIMTKIVLNAAKKKHLKLQQKVRGYCPSSPDEAPVVG